MDSRIVGSNINLLLTGYPLPLRLHAGMLLGLGLALTFVPGLVVNNPIFRGVEQLLGLPAYKLESPAEKKDAAATHPAAASAGRTAHQGLTTTGLLAFGLGLSYIGTASLNGITPETNQLVYASIPLRVLMVMASLTEWIINPSSRDAFKVIMLMEDTVGTAWLYYAIRHWPGWNVA